MRPSNANQVCDVIDRLDDEDIEVKILESLEKCYLYDDSGPKFFPLFPYWRPQCERGHRRF